MNDGRQRRLSLRGERRHRLSRLMTRARSRIARVFSPHRVSADGVRYVALGPGSLTRALAKTGPGYKDYRVRFPDASTMTIRTSRVRVHADLSGPRLLKDAPCFEQLVRPGMRVLVAGGGTGYLPAWVAGRVGVSGDVVSLERDAQSVEFATRRYDASNIAFETGWTDALLAELDAGFDIVLALRSLQADDGLDRDVPELWRTLAPGGWLVLALPDGSATTGFPLRDPEGSWRCDTERIEGSIMDAVGDRATLGSFSSPLGGRVFVVNKASETE